MLAGFIVGFLTSVNNPIYNLRIDDFGIRLMVTTGISMAVWIPAMLLTKPETDERLDTFYRRVRPGGPGWKRQRERTGMPAVQDLGRDLLRVCASLMILFGLMFGTGGFLFSRWLLAAVMTSITLIGYFWLRWLRIPVPTERVAQPPAVT
jgi:hypothetical protein